MNITMRRLLASTSLTMLALVATPVMAQVTTPAAPTQQAPLQVAPTPNQRPSETDMSRLIGRTVRNAAEENVGEITSVMVGRDGTVTSVIVGVGGFLGIGQREVAIRWQDIQVRDNGAIVHTSVTRAQLAALPEYQYAPNQRRGTVIGGTATTTAPTTAQAPAPVAVQVAPPVGTSAAAPAAPSPTQRASETDTARLIGRTVRNSAEESIGEVTSVVIGRDGSVASVIVGVGGFLGMGQREVAIRWQDIQVRDNGAIVHTNVTRAQLAALPEYRYAPNQRPGTIIGTPVTSAPAAMPGVTAPAMTGRLSANDLIGSTVRSPANDSIGRVYDVLMDDSGMARALVVSSGGVMGIGDRRVELAFGDVRLVRDGGTLNVVSRLTAAQIAQVTEYAPTMR